MNETNFNKIPVFVLKIKMQNHLQDLYLKGRVLQQNYLIVFAETFESIHRFRHFDNISEVVLIFRYNYTQGFQEVVNKILVFIGHKWLSNNLEGIQ